MNLNVENHSLLVFIVKKSGLMLLQLISLIRVRSIMTCLSETNAVNEKGLPVFTVHLKQIIFCFLAALT